MHYAFIFQISCEPCEPSRRFRRLALVCYVLHGEQANSSITLRDFAVRALET